MEYDVFCLLATLILIDDRKLRVQIRGLMQTAFYLILFKTGLLKDFRIRQEIDLCSGFFVFPITGSSTFSSASTGTPRS